MSMVAQVASEETEHGTLPKWHRVHGGRCARTCGADFCRIFTSALGRSCRAHPCQEGHCDALPLSKDGRCARGLQDRTMRVLGICVGRASLRASLPRRALWPFAAILPRPIGSLVRAFRRTRLCPCLHPGFGGSDAGEASSTLGRALNHRDPVPMYTCA